jgi:glycosyltransferase involved in cell wall biosynthesis
VFAKATTRLIAFTNVSRTELVDHLRICSRKVIVIPNGVEFSVLEGISHETKALLKQQVSPQGEKIVGNVGRLHPHKNQALFLRAAASVLSGNRYVKFVIDGDGPLRSPLQTLAQELNLSDHLIFTGWSPDVYALMSTLDIFVLSSVTECAPTVVLEAMGLGVPVIATAVGGVPDIIDHGRTGLLVPSGDDRCLAEAILHLLRHPEEARRIGENGREWCRQHCDFTKIARKVEEVYEAARIPETR